MHTCNECGQKFDTKMKLFNHINSAHEVEDEDESEDNPENAENTECKVTEDCDEVTPRWQTRLSASHGKNIKNSKVTNDENESLCCMCAMVFASEQSLDSHIKKEHPDVKHKCKVHGCRYLFTTC